MAHPTPTESGLATVTVYTKDACVQCDMTKKRLRLAGIPFDEVAVDDPANAEALTYITEQRGFRAAPVVIVYNADDSERAIWGGYRPDLIDDHLANDQATS
jgi:glutaredoxin-like protein NrdH